MEAKEKVKCKSCNGTGKVMISCCTDKIIPKEVARCPKCQENLVEEDCPDCTVKKS